MKCVVNLYDENENIEIVTDINDEIIKEFQKFIDDTDLSSEQFIHVLIKTFGKCVLLRGEYENYNL